MLVVISRRSYSTFGNVPCRSYSRVRKQSTGVTTVALHCLPFHSACVWWPPPSPDRKSYSTSAIGPSTVRQVSHGAVVAAHGVDARACTEHGDRPAVGLRKKRRIAPRCRPRVHSQSERFTCLQWRVVGRIDAAASHAQRPRPKAHTFYRCAFAIRCSYCIRRSRSDDFGAGMPAPTCP